MAFVVSTTKENIIQIKTKFVPKARGEQIQLVEIPADCLKGGVQGRKGMDDMGATARGYSGCIFTAVSS